MFGRSVVAGAVAVFVASGSVFGAREMRWSAYDIGSSGDIAVAIGQPLKQAYQSDMRILPSGDNTARLGPVKTNRTVISQMGIGTHLEQEGVFEFGAGSWGPQASLLIRGATACNGLGLAAIAKDTSVKEVKDLKGKRLGIVVGSPALMQGVVALIAFGGLTEET